MVTKKKRSDPAGPQFKALAFETKDVAAEPDDDGIVTFKAYGSVFGNVDSHKDVVHAGAFENSLKEWAASGAPIPSYYNHGMHSGDPMDNIGFLKSAVEDDHGLAVEVALDVGANPKAAYVHRLIKADRLRELSIGYIAKRWDYIEDEKDDWWPTRNLLEVDLLEVSVVSKASNGLATVTEKAALLAYGSPSKADDATDADADSVAEALAAISSARDALDLAEAALAADDSDDDSGDEVSDGDDNASDDGDGEPAGAKSLSARARVALAMIAVSAAETE